ncbi:hypothetical protein V6N13_083981 [Hibiscus sabdariffa]
MSEFVSNTLGLNREANEFSSMDFESNTTRDVNCGGIGAEIVVIEGFLFVEEEDAEGKVRIVFELECNLGELGKGETEGEHRMRSRGTRPD